MIVSDYNAIAELIQHGVAADLVEAAALALKAGVDIDMMADAYRKGLPAALERGLVEMARSTQAVLPRADAQGAPRPVRRSLPARKRAAGSTAGDCRPPRRARGIAGRSVVLLTNPRGACCRFPPSSAMSP